MINKTQKFIKKARQIHGDRYDYSKVEYVNANIKVCIICPEHGEFWQTPRQHLKGQGCLSCSNIKCCNTEEFIAKAKRVHVDKYDYSKVNYINNRTKVCIICPEHGEFWQRPDNHLQGQGCPVCNSSKLEFEIFNFLSNHNISFKRQKKFEWLINEKTGYNLYLDFYLPDYNIAIECQGEQHYEDTWGNNKLEYVQNNDKQKYLKCIDNNVKILYYTSDKIKRRYSLTNVIVKKSELLKTIKKEKL